MPQKTKNTPMMEQYLTIKAQYPDAFLFYRLGDFYEMFYDDAQKAAHLLELTLTSRNKNAVDPIPMCGIPYHAAQGYIDALVEQGYKVAICEQVEDPKTTKGMVKREVVQVVTPGTTVHGNGKEAKESNYLAAICYQEKQDNYAFAYVELSTGELKVALLGEAEAVVNECAALQTKEVVVMADFPLALREQLTQRLQIVFSKAVEDPLPAALNQLMTAISDDELRQVLDQLLRYLFATQKRSLDHLQTAIAYEPAHYLKLDVDSKANLELTRSLRSGKKSGTLLWLLDETKTAMGGRLLKQWVDRPLISRKAIVVRQARVQSLLDAFFERTDGQEVLKQVYDLERLAGKVAMGSVNGRDLLQLKQSLANIPALRSLLEGLNTDGTWSELLERLDPIQELGELIEGAIREDAGLSVTEGNVLKDGYNEQLDQYRHAMRHGKEWIAELETKEREETGIRTLKIGFNRVFGYYIEITRSNLAHLPEDRYERKQTLANAERFITPELKETEQLILEAEEKSQGLEYQLFVEIREEVKQAISRLQKLAQAVAEVDVIQAFATIAERYQYVRPTLTENQHQLLLREGRHPVVEKVIGQQEYVPNSVEMDPNTQIMLITGPNMSGKSTYMRQLALISIMAQIGSFVPAEEAILPVFDQIFTRIGASDDLISGQSTFMVEMMEANRALRHATANSLILFDEIGRGTATYDGMALAEAIIEYIHQEVHAKTLFSTHYHELTELDTRLPNLVNCHVGAVEKDGEVVFLHKMMAGPADKSYGIHVAKLAGLPTALLERAQVILSSLENQAASATSDPQPEGSTAVQKTELVAEPETAQLSLFSETTPEEQQVIEQLKAINVLEMNPIEALNTLYALKKAIK